MENNCEIHSNGSIEMIKASLLQAGFSEEELEKEVERKREEFGGFISEKGILFLIAKDHDLPIRSPDIDRSLYDLVEQEEIDYDEFRIDIAQLEEGLSNVVIIGRIVKTYPIHYFARKDGTTGKISSFLLQDNSAMIKVVMWDDLADIVNEEAFEVNQGIRVIGGYTKMNKDRLEVHLGKKSRLMFLSKEEAREKQLREASEMLPYVSHTKNNKVSEKKLSKNAYLPYLSGKVLNFTFKEFDRKKMEKSFLLKITILAEENKEYIVNFWKFDAIEVLKLIEKGNLIYLTNLKSKENPYTKEKEFHYTDRSTLNILN